MVELKNMYVITSSRQSVSSIVVDQDKYPFGIELDLDEAVLAAIEATPGVDAYEVAADRSSDPERDDD